MPKANVLNMAGSEVGDVELSEASSASSPTRLLSMKW